MLGARPAGKATLLQHKVVVGCRVHSVEDVGVVWDLQLCRGRPTHRGVTGVMHVETASGMTAASEEGQLVVL